MWDRCCIEVETQRPPAQSQRLPWPLPLATLIRALPTTRALLPAGDFRDWTDIESWADDIARSLSDGPRDEAPGSRP